MKDKSIFTRAVHAGSDRRQFHGAASVPIFNASIYAFDNAETAEAIHNEVEPGYYYGRLGNPTQEAVDAAIADLESAEAALTFASGMSAISGIFLSFVKPGDRVTAPVSLYSTTGKLLRYMHERFQIDVDLVDGKDSHAVAHSIEQGSKLVWIETPSNPILSISDIAAITAVARDRGCVSVVDSTFATPFNQLPIKLGADLVVHSGTKYFGGHSDLTAGAVAGSAEHIALIRSVAGKLLGGNIAPFVAWLLHRGLKTLPLRMERHNENTYALANMLDRHPAVRIVYYPGLESHHGHEIAAKQMIGGFGGMVSFDLGSRSAAAAFVSAVRLCSLATSLGGVETIVQHSTAMTNAGMSKEDQRVAGIPDGLVRMSVGIEHIDDIMADIDQALAVI